MTFALPTLMTGSSWKEFWEHSLIRTQACPLITQVLGAAADKKEAWKTRTPVEELEGHVQLGTLLFLYSVFQTSFTF